MIYISYIVCLGALSPLVHLKGNWCGIHQT